MIANMQITMSQEIPAAPQKHPSPLEDELSSLLGNDRVQWLHKKPVASEQAATSTRRSSGREFIVFLERYRANVDESHNAALAMRWLSENRNLYQGRWVALRGNVLLAEGDSAKAVYAQLPAVENPPFIIKVDVLQQEPFAGW